MKVLLIEDEPKTATALAAFLVENSVEVDWISDGAAGLRMALLNPYDVIVSDVIMPNIQGIALCRRLREAGVKSPILIVSALAQPEEKVLGLQAGADDYLGKPVDFNELLARLHALVRRSNQPPMLPQVLAFEDLELNLSTLEVHRAGVKITLTPREFALLEYLVRHAGRVVPKSEILERVWNIDERINTKVIEVYVNYVRNKVDKGFSKKLIHTHFGVGYVLKTES